MSSWRTQQLGRRTSSLARMTSASSSAQKVKPLMSRNATYPAAFPPQSQEMTGLNKIIKADRGSKGRAIIAVVHPENLADLDQQCRPSRLKFWQNNDLVRTTNPEDLQKAIDALQGDRRVQHLTLLVSQKVDDITIHVGGGITTLSIFRATHDHSPDGHLLVSGASTFRSVRLDEWQGKHQQQHALYLGEGVGISIGFSAETQWGSYSDALSELEKSEIYQQFKRMHVDDGPGAGGPPWAKWQGSIATILGLLTGNKEMAESVKATADGMYVGYQFGAAAVKIVAAGLGTSTAISAAGPATMLGIGAAAAVYFIPWNGLFGWLEGVFARLYRSVLAMWRKLVESLTRQILGSSGKALQKQPLYRMVTM